MDQLLDFIEDGGTTKDMVGGASYTVAFVPTPKYAAPWPQSSTRAGPQDDTGGADVVEDALF
jgi:hypothetical protein